MENLTNNKVILDYAKVGGKPLEHFGCGAGSSMINWCYKMLFLLDKTLDKEQW